MTRTPGSAAPTATSGYVFMRPSCRRSARSRQLDRRRDPVQTGHHFPHFVREELVCGLRRVPDVEVVRARLGLVEGEELEAKARHAFERRALLLGNAGHAGTIERSVVLEAHVDSDHGSSLILVRGAATVSGILVRTQLTVNDP